MPKSADYALIMHNAAYHVASKLEEAAPAALSFTDLTQFYQHPLPSDLSRVKRHENVDGDYEAKAWVIRYAVELLDGGLAVDGDMVSFTPGKGFDDQRLYGEKIRRPGPDPHARLRDAFNPMTSSGVFAGNIREEIGDLTELRESMKAWGWISEFPALVDERGVVLVGNRRMKVAGELGIQPVTRTLVLGQGDAADAERFKLAIASNIGGKKLSPNDRKRIAEYLYSDREWSQQKIADALMVDQKTVSRDLGELGVVPKSKRGRPRKDEPEKKPKKGLVDKVLEQSNITPEQEEKVAAMVDAGFTREQIVKETGLGKGTVEASKQRHVGRVQERQRIEQAREDMITQLTQETGEHFCTCPNCGHRHLRENPE
jgi:ParB-like chromosome segregation protein Spo0J